MSLLSSIVDYGAQAITEYKERANDCWARSVVANLDEVKVHSIFDKVAKGKLVGGFSDRAAFFSNAQKFDVAILRTVVPNSSKKERIIMVFYVGGISDEALEVSNCSYDHRPSVLKIRDVVSPIFISNYALWTLPKETVESDFAKCVNHSKTAKEHPLNTQFYNSAPLLERVVTGSHPHFSVISKADFDKRSYIVARVYIDSFKIEKGDTLVIFGNGIGMDDWTRPIPMRRAPSHPEDCWDTTIRGKQETCEYKLALLKSDGGFLLDQSENRKFKDIKLDEHGNYSLKLSPPIFDDGDEVRL
jgi:hypothetical protein